VISFSRDTSQIMEKYCISQHFWRICKNALVWIQISVTCSVCNGFNELHSTLPFHVLKLKNMWRNKQWHDVTLVVAVCKRSGYDETTLAIGLGFTCHLVAMISNYLDIPLRYPMLHRGSRSLIYDHIMDKLSENERELVPCVGSGVLLHHR